MAMNQVAEAKGQTHDPGELKAAQLEWLMVQNTRLMGLHKIYWTDSAIRIASENNGYVLVSHAPDWKIYGFRDDDKVYKCGTLEEFHSEYPPISSAQHLIKLDTKQLESLTLSHYHALNGSSPVDIVLVESPRPRAQVADILSAYYRLWVPSHSLLFEMYRSGPSKNIKSRIETWHNDIWYEASNAQGFMITKMLKKVPYHAADFECPKGYKLATKEEIFTSKSQKDQLGGLFEELDLGRNFGKK